MPHVVFHYTIFVSLRAFCFGFALLKSENNRGGRYSESGGDNGTISVIFFTRNPYTPGPCHIDQTSRLHMSLRLRTTELAVVGTGRLTQESRVRGKRIFVD